jgi:hypothetical protein
MRVRFLGFISLGLAAAFLVVASQSFALFDIANLALGIGIGLLVISLAVAARYRRHIPSLISGATAGLVSAWMIVSSQIFSLSTVQSLTFAESLGIAGLALIGLVGHELGTERVFHSLEMRAGSPQKDPRNERALV